MTFELIEGPDRSGAEGAGGSSQTRYESKGGAGATITTSNGCQQLEQAERKRK